MAPATRRPGSPRMPQTTGLFGPGAGPGGGPPRAAAIIAAQSCVVGFNAGPSLPSGRASTSA